MVLQRDRIKLKLLEGMEEDKVYSLYSLAKLCGTNSKTVKDNLEFLERIGLVEIDKVGKEESASGVPSYRVRITREGLRASERT